jgi:hypothetical protein
MKPIFYLLAATVLLAGCRSNKDYLQRSDGDKALLDAVRKLNKKPQDADATRALPILYTDAQQRHLARIKYFEERPEPERWQGIIMHYDKLQGMYDAIVNSPAASQLLRPTDYQTEIDRANLAAAQTYYQLGTDALELGTYAEAREAYQHFKAAQSYVSDYKDTRKKIAQAYQLSIVNIVVNPLTDNAFAFNSGWGNTGYNYSNEYFQQNLVRDLGGNYANRYPARFYTDWEARRENITPDWVVNITLRNLDIPRPVTHQNSRNVSQRIESGRDTAGNIIYQTVYATITTHQQSFTARADMDIEIGEVSTRRNIAHNSYREQYDWQDAYATFTGDRRALSNEDRQLVANQNYRNLPRREEVLNELYRRLYPSIRNRIVNAVSW